MSTNKQKTVFVGLSGGVDSSVAALRLKREGYFVVGVFIKVWHPDFLVCNWEQERLDAMRVAAVLDIPFLTCDATEAYKKHVADYFIHEYTQGRTPNPDVMCNKSVKFGAFLEYAIAQGADYIATGHYAQVGHDMDGHRLTRGVDDNKDQSYFLWTLTQEQLARVLLPVGMSQKSDIRAQAASAGLPTAQKKDSQGVCFLGHIDIPDFLSHFTPLMQGAVLDEKGNILGSHKGALVYTLGQRHGFTVDEHVSDRSAHYVIERNIEKNTITVGPKPPQQNSGDLLRLEGVNYILYEPKVGDVLSAQTRYRQIPQTVTVTHVGTHSLILSFNKTSEISTPGQSCVLYRGRRCLGGGIIS